MRLLFLAEGERDHRVVPKLVRRVLGRPVDVTFSQWRTIRLNRGSGYRRKLGFAMLQARDQEQHGVVATVDSDRNPPGAQLRKLQDAREDDRNSLDRTPLPVAVGEAVPHLEAWLLDDPCAVREVCCFASSRLIANVLQVDPKSVVDEYFSKCERHESPLILLGEIAERWAFGRCNHASETGLAGFIEDVHRELE